MNQKVKNNSLSKKVLVSILLASSLLTFILTTFQLYFDYKDQLSTLELELEQIKKSYIKPLSDAIWTFNDVQVNHLTDSIITVPDVKYVSIKVKYKKDISETGSKENIKHSIEKVYDLKILKNQQVIELGRLTVVAQEDEIRERVYNKIVIILVSQFLKTFIISFFILFIIRRLVMAPLQKLSSFADEFTIGQDTHFRKLEYGLTHSSGQLNELGHIENSLNEMKSRINKDVQLKQRLIQDNMKQSNLLALGTLAGGIAHDFNNILQGIFNSNNLIKAYSDKENLKINNCVNESMKFAEQGKKIVQGILQFSRNETIQLKPIDLLSSVNEVVELGRINRFRGCHIEVRNTATKTVVDSSKHLLFQLFTNLIANACDVVDLESGKIIISIDNSEDEKSLYIKIADNGAGISKEKLERIFDPFFTTKPVGEGTGLGLSIVHGIVNDLKGHINVSSELNIGTEFIITFNVSEQVESLSSEDSEITHETNGQNKEIVLVDDEEDILVLTQEWLEGDGHKVKIFTSPNECLVYLEQNEDKIAAIFTDFTMPIMNGLELGKEIRKRSKSIPLFLVSGFIKTDLDLSIFNGKIDKPFSAKDIRDALNNS